MRMCLLCYAQVMPSGEIKAWLRPASRQFGQVRNQVWPNYLSLSSDPFPVSAACKFISEINQTGAAISKHLFQPDMHTFLSAITILLLASCLIIMLLVKVS